MTGEKYPNLSRGEITTDQPSNPPENLDEGKIITKKDIDTYRLYRLIYRCMPGLFKENEYIINELYRRMPELLRKNKGIYEEFNTESDQNNQ